MHPLVQQVVEEYRQKHAQQRAASSSVLLEQNQQQQHQQQHQQQQQHHADDTLEQMFGPSVWPPSQRKLEQKSHQVPPGDPQALLEVSPAADVPTEIVESPLLRSYLERTGRLGLLRPPPGSGRAQQLQNTAQAEMQTQHDGPRAALLEIATRQRPPPPPPLRPAPGQDELGINHV